MNNNSYNSSTPVSSSPIVLKQPPPRLVLGLLFLTWSTISVSTLRQFVGTSSQFPKPFGTTVVRRGRMLLRL